MFSSDKNPVKLSRLYIGKYVGRIWWWLLVPNQICHLLLSLDYALSSTLAAKTNPASSILFWKYCHPTPQKILISKSLDISNCVRNSSSTRFRPHGPLEAYSVCSWVCDGGLMIKLTFLFEAIVEPVPFPEGEKKEDNCWHADGNSPAVISLLLSFCCEPQICHMFISFFTLSKVLKILPNLSHILPKWIMTKKGCIWCLFSGTRRVTSSDLTVQLSVASSRSFGHGHVNRGVCDERRRRWRWYPLGNRRSNW